MFEIGVAATCFGLVFVGELPDKTAIASLVLGARFPGRWVFTGVAAAFLVHVVIAVAAGSVVSLLPHRVTEILVGLLFLLGAYLVWREGLEEDEDDEVDEAVAEESVAVPDAAGFWKVAGLGFATIFIAEWGDLTQILTANLAVKYHNPLSVGVGAVLGLWCVALLAMLGGQALLKVIPMKWITRVAAVILVCLGLWSLYRVITG